MNANKTVVFTKNNCPNCDATKAHLDRLSVSYETVNLSDSPELIETITAMGFRSAPVVLVSSGEKWAGYKPERIEEVFGA